MSVLPRSPLAPSRPPLPVLAGVEAAVAQAGIRYAGRDDLLLMVFAPGTTVAGVFTRNRCPGAPVDWCRHALKRGRARGLVVNSGNANVFTGRQGLAAVRATAEQAAELLGCRPRDVFVASTGVIGEMLPQERIAAALPGLATRLAADGWNDAARAIMTTDTFPKVARREAVIGGVTVSLQGIAKGSGMVAPDLATMLCFIATDAAIPPEILQDLLRRSTEDSFNRTTVDSDTSTSDTVLLFATGQAEHPPVAPGDRRGFRDFRNALDELMLDLALQVVRDGEGAQKLIRVDVTGAASKQSARRVALAIANSPLVKTAVAGGDANWGRVVMAVGKSGEPADRDTLSVGIGGTWMARDGAVVPGYDEAPVAAHIAGREIDIAVDLGLGQGRATAWTCDLTHGYIDINASYRS